MDKIKTCIAKSLSGDEPSPEETADAIVEALGVVGSIATSLERIAAAQEQIAASV